MKKLLIANRGEIAVRIIRTAKVLGIPTIAVFSEADREHPHVSFADESHCIGPAAATESYLHIGRILLAAKLHGADAVHPGYGFLAESPTFSAAVADAGMIFVGPTAEVMRRIGLKDEARRLAAKLNIPIPAGFDRNDAPEADAISAARKLGYPLLIKAAAGGGGRGMRRVENESALPEALKQAEREALTAFGDGRLLFEQLITPARHIEIQVIADKHGKVLHLFERDCSFQRRYQKLLEISPAEKLSKHLRERMYQAAIDLVGAAGLVGAATVEFLVPLKPTKGGPGFFFLEVNPRIQVEHPVTEMVTGIDIVEWQLRVARGEALPLAQKDIATQGVAIQARIYAEMPAQGFRPTTGTIHRIILPDALPNATLRIDHALKQKMRVETHYDSLLMKVIVSAKSHQLAYDQLQSALNQICIDGVETNIPFLVSVLSQSESIVDTGTIERNSELLASNIPAERFALRALCAALLYRAGCFAHPIAGPPPFFQALPLKHTAAVPLFEPVRTWRVRCGYLRHEHTFAACLRTLLSKPADIGRFSCEIEGREYELRIGQIHAEQSELLIDGEPVVFSGWRVNSFDHLEIGINGLLFTVQLESADLIPTTSETTKSNRVLAHLPGTVTAIKVKVGEKVAAGITGAILESMKMEHSLVIPRDGIIEEIQVGIGSRVKEGDTILTLKASEQLEPNYSALSTPRIEPKSRKAKYATKP